MIAQGYARGVTVSYFEWVQNQRGWYWALPRVHAQLEAVMSRAFQRVHDLSSQLSVDMPTAAYVVALRRLADARDAVT